MTNEEYPECFSNGFRCRYKMKVKGRTAFDQKPDVVHHTDGQRSDVDVRPAKGVVVSSDINDNYRAARSRIHGAEEGRYLVCD